MNKLFAIYMCLFVILVSIVLPLAFPTILVVLYMEQGFSGIVVTVSILTILIEPLAIGLSYILLTDIKDMYNDLIGM